MCDAHMHACLNVVTFCASLLDKFVYKVRGCRERDKRRCLLLICDIVNIVCFVALRVCCIQLGVVYQSSGFDQSLRS